MYVSREAGPQEKNKDLVGPKKKCLAIRSPKLAWNRHPWVLSKAEAHNLEEGGSSMMTPAV